MLESVFRLGEQARFIQELRRLQMRQAAVQRLFGQVRNGLQQGEGHVRANHSGGLEQALLLRWQAVDACRQHGVHCGRHLQALQGPGQAIRP
jgi:hypothetical protein